MPHAQCQQLHRLGHDLTSLHPGTTLTSAYPFRVRDTDEGLPLRHYHAFHAASHMAFDANYRAAHASLREKDTLYGRDFLILDGKIALCRLTIARFTIYASRAFLRFEGFTIASAADIRPRAACWSATHKHTPYYWRHITSYSNIRH